jgi:hypothetical protein
LKPSLIGPRSSSGSDYDDTPSETSWRRDLLQR